MVVWTRPSGWVLGTLLQWLLPPCSSLQAYPSKAVRHAAQLELSGRWRHEAAIRTRQQVFRINGITTG